MLRISVPETVRRVLDAIRRAGGHPLLVGGAVRDALLGLTTDDWDIEAYAIGVTELVDALRSLGSVNQVGKSFGVLKLSVEGTEIDVALPRRESKAGRGHRGFMIDPDPAMTPREAASRRDFTINAMLWDPQREELLDFFGGEDDLRSRTLRHIGPAFADDPLRVLRGVQLAGRFELQAHASTVELSRALRDEYETLASERIWAEWEKWASRSSLPSAGLEYLARSGWRTRYAAIEALDGCPQDPEWHPEGDVWRHTLLVVDCAAAIAMRDGLDGAGRTALVLAALCHDLGKPETTVSDESGRIRSPGHAGCEATIAECLLAIGCPRRLADRVLVLSRHHLAHTSFVGSQRHVRRLARALGEGGETIEMLARLVEADHSGRPPLPGGMPEEMAAMVREAELLAMATAAPEPLLRGRDLIALGIEPGPRMGGLLAAAYEAQLDGRFDSHEGAVAWARRALNDS